MSGLGPAWAAVGLLACAAAASAGGTVGLVPDPDPARHQQLVRGAELALRAPGSPRLVVGRQTGHWNGLTAVIEELVAGEGAEVLVAPADRRAAHLVAQIATRRHLPAIATSAQGGLAATGSWWLVTCEWHDSDSTRLAEHLGRSPSEWELAGWSAARVARLLLEVPSESWTSPGSTWRERLPESCLRADPGPRPSPPHHRKARHEGQDR